jgi:multiple sugar transport system substrate-binding protein
VPSIYKPWHFPWSDRINIEVSKALTGQITADACCDNLIAAIKEVQKG